MRQAKEMRLAATAAAGKVKDEQKVEKVVEPEPVAAENIATQGKLKKLIEDDENELDSQSENILIEIPKNLEKVLQSQDFKALFVLF